MLKKGPANLRTLAIRHDGKFPEDYVGCVVRFGGPVLGYGSSHMPAWGLVFAMHENGDEAAVRRRITNCATIWRLFRTRNPSLICFRYISTKTHQALATAGKPLFRVCAAIGNVLRQFRNSSSLLQSMLVIASRQRRLKPVSEIMNGETH
jgi:hypothetical protein